jgi:hypothetical protein
LSSIETKLWAHPAAGPTMALDPWIDIRLDRLSATNLHLIYKATGKIGDLVMPLSAPPFRTPNLWNTTCFELFLRGEHRTGYREFNFSPSGQWAAYDFQAYRAGMTQARMPGDPVIEADIRPDCLTINVRLSLDLWEDPYSVGLAAVIEERALGLSYWAANHAGDKADFHHPASFDLELPPAPPTSPRT